MGQDLYFRGQLCAGNNVYTVAYGGRAKYFPVSTGEDIGKMVLDLFREIASQLQKEGTIDFWSSLDFEGSRFIRGKLNNPEMLYFKESIYDYDEEEDEEPEIQWLEDPETSLRFVLGEENPDYTITLYGDFTEIDLKRLKNIIAYHTGYRCEYMVSENMPTIWKEWLGVKIPLEVLPLPEKLEEVLNLESFTLGNKPNGVKYFGVGDKSFVSRENRVDRLISQGKVAMWEKDGETYLFIAPEEREKVGIALALGALTLSCTFSEHNEPFQEAYGRWLKENNYRQFEKTGGLGDREIHWFHWEP